VKVKVDEKTQEMRSRQGRWMFFPRPEVMGKSIPRGISRSKASPEHEE
jgi:hypothetical protein